MEMASVGYGGKQEPQDCAFDKLSCARLLKGALRSKRGIDGYGQPYGRFLSKADEDGGF